MAADLAAALNPGFRDELEAHMQIRAQRAAERAARNHLLNTD
jgi:hypothetical protein